MSVDFLYELMNKNKQDELLLPLAILYKEYDIIKTLINDPLTNTSYCYNNLPTHCAVQYGHLDILKMLLEKYPCTDDLLDSATYEITKYLLEERLVDPNNSRAFFFATQNNNLDIVELLLEYNLTEYSVNFGLFTAKKWKHNNIVKVIENYLEKIKYL